MPPMQQSDFQAFHAFLIKQKGSFSTFTFEYPLENQGADKAQTDILVNGALSIGSNSIAMDGFTNSTTGVLKAGDLIKFAGSGHTKVYMVTADTNSNGSGQASVSIEPPLQVAIANDEAVTVNKPSFTVALVQDDILYSTDASGLFSLGFEVREVL